MIIINLNGNCYYYDYAICKACNLEAAGAWISILFKTRNVSAEITKRTHVAQVIR